MLTQLSKNAKRRHVHERIRKKVMGTSERPRLNVYRSLNHIYVQLIDDLKGATLVSANSAEVKKGERRIGGKRPFRKNGEKMHAGVTHPQEVTEKIFVPGCLTFYLTAKAMG